MADSFEKVVQGDYCVGCGLCKTVTNNKIKMEYDSYGKFTPQLISALDETDNEKIEKTCPFSNGIPDENQLAEAIWDDPQLRNDSHLGKYIKLYAGAVLEGDFRGNGSSGGFGTWILNELLKAGIVDKVIHVKAHDDSDRTDYFKYSVSSSLNEIIGGASSKYHPIELSEVLEYVQKNNFKYAIIGIPCFVKGIRLLQRDNLVFQQRIKVVGSLFCGHLKSLRYTELLAREAGLNKNSLKTINYRHKVMGRRADKYASKFILQDNSEIIKNNDSFKSTNWGLGLLKLKACDYCDDVVGELGDFSIGDGWLPKYVKESKGTNVLIIRNQIIEKLIDDAHKAQRVWVESVTENDIKRSQAGGFRHRREGLSYRLHLKKIKQEWYPIKRVKPKNDLPVKRKKILETRMRLLETSHLKYKESRNQNDINIFFRGIKNDLNAHKRLTHISLFQKVLKKVVNLMK